MLSTAPWTCQYLLHLRRGQGGHGTLLCLAQFAPLDGVLDVGARDVSRDRREQRDHGSNQCCGELWGHVRAFHRATSVAPSSGLLGETAAGAGGPALVALGRILDV